MPILVVLQSGHPGGVGSPNWRPAGLEKNKSGTVLVRDIHTCSLGSLRVQQTSRVAFYMVYLHVKLCSFM